MATLVDTGILLRAFDANYPDYRAIRRSLRKALDDGETLGRHGSEHRRVLERGNAPLRKHGQGLSAEQVKRRVVIIEKVCEVVAEDSLSYDEWKRLIEDYGVSGVSVHDARLVSVMLRLGMKQILTLNERHFQRYLGEGITVSSPRSFSGETS